MRAAGLELSESPAARCSHPSSWFRPIFSTRDYITGEPFVVGFCNVCRFYVTTPVPPTQNISRYYPAGYYGSGQRFNPAVEWLLNRLYNHRASHIEGKLKPGKVLDIGCGRGLLLNKLRERGWDPFGTELSEEAAAFARDGLGLPVTTKPVEEANFPDAEFDLVILWHVLEHVTAPRETLREVGRILKPGGTLLIAVPNFGSWEAQWALKKWFHLDVPRHLTHFTPKTLDDALEDAGLRRETSSYFSSEYDFFSFVQTVQNKLGLRHNLLYDLLRTRSAKVLQRDDKKSSVPVRDIAAALGTAIPLAVLSALYAPVVAALGRGATMAIYAVRKG